MTNRDIMQARPRAMSAQRRYRVYRASRLSCYKALIPFELQMLLGLLPCSVDDSIDRYNPPQPDRARSVRCPFECLTTTSVSYIIAGTRASDSSHLQTVSDHGLLFQQTTILR